MRLPRCKRHSQPAGWRCKGCRALLCPDCVAVKRVQTATELEVCVDCDELAEPITVHRSQLQGFAPRVLRALVWPISKAGLITMVGVGLLRALLSYAPGLGWVFSICALATVCFGLIRSTARGSDDFDVTDFSDLVNDLLLPGLKAMVGASIVWVPMSFWVYLRWDVIKNKSDFASDPVMWLMLAFGVFYAPMAVLVGAAGNSLISMLNPLFVVRHALRLGPDYAIAVMTLCILAVPWLLVSSLGSMIDAIVPVPFLPRLLDYTMACYVPFVAARVLGLLLFVRGDQVGYGVESDYLQPVLASAVPRGVLHETVVAAVDTDVAQAAVRDRYAPIELDDEPELATAPAPAAEPSRRRMTELDPAALPPLPESDES